MAGPDKGGGPEGTDDREETPPPLTKEHIEEVVGLEYKMPNNIKLYDGTTDPKDRLSRFASVANSGEWPMPVWCRMFQQTLDGSARGWFERLPPNSINEWAYLREAFAARFSIRRSCFKEPHEITKIIRRANESLTAFKERWTVETGFIMGVPEVMKISSFMDSVKSPELAKRFSDKVPMTVNEMMERLDDFVRSEEAYASTELPKEETGESHRKISLPSNGRDVWPLRNTRSRESRRDDYRNRYRGRDTYHANRPRDDRFAYPSPRGEYNRRVAPEAVGDGTGIGKVKPPGKGRTTGRKRTPWPRRSTNGQDNQCDQCKPYKDCVERDPNGPGRVRRRGIEATRKDRPGGVFRKVQFKDPPSLSIHHSRNDEVPNSKKGSYAGYSDAHHCGVQTVRKETNGRRRRNLEAYVNDMVIKRRDEKILLANILETFDNLNKINMKLNPKKCSCGVEEGKFLGYMVLADFLSEAPEGEKEELYFRMPKVPLEKDDTRTWTLFNDGASSLKGSRAGLVLIGPNGIGYTYDLRLTFPGTNNEAEYEALLAGPLPPTIGGAKFTIMTIDYFTKWIEVKPLVKITGKEIIRFVMDNIICRFGLPRVIVTDNEAQLVNNPFKSWCGRFEIHHMNTAVAHPQENGLVERANRRLMEGIKTRLGKEKAGWVDELPNVLWAHQTSIKQSDGETPFSLTYGSKTERRETVVIREARYKPKMEQYYNKKVSPSGFRPEEFVFRRNEASRVEDQGKLGPKWEGSYRVVEAYENSSYKLQTLENKEVPRTWHAINLRKFYM
nr:putative reverse transcriptase domain-containing protein [Tanacetum cinerariifolium]